MPTHTPASSSTLDDTSVTRRPATIDSKTPSISRRYWGSIITASLCEMPNAPQSKRSAPSTKPPKRAVIEERPRSESTSSTAHRELGTRLMASAEPLKPTERGSVCVHETMLHVRSEREPPSATAAASVSAAGATHASTHTRDAMYDTSASTDG